MDATALLNELAVLGVKVDAILPDGTHLYWCTSHRHGNPDHCASNINIHGGVKEPGRCKSCPAVCRDFLAPSTAGHVSHNSPPPLPPLPPLPPPEDPPGWPTRPPNLTPPPSSAPGVLGSPPGADTPPSTGGR